MESSVQEPLNVRDSSQIERFLARPQIKELLARWIGGVCRVELLSDAPERGVVYRVFSDRDTCVVRFPLDEEQKAALRKESRIERMLHQLVGIDIPETAFFSSTSGRPAFAIHRWVDGVPLTADMYVHMSEESRHQLVHALAGFLVTLHSVELAEATMWCDDGTVEQFHPETGRPKWFSKSLRARIPGTLYPRLKPGLVSAVTQTIREFEALTVSREELVLGHGDIHGYNLAMRPTATGYELGGIIDFELAGILDVHEDFFRLYFVSSDLVDRLIGAYERKREHKISLDRARISLYWHAFLVYLMIEHLEMDDLDMFQLYEKLLVETVKDKR